MSHEVSERARADVLRNRVAILDAAAEVLGEDPSASLAHVAQRAGLGRATLYRHFPSRESLSAALREEALARAESALADADLDRGSAREAVRRAVEGLIPLGTRFQVILAEGAEQDPGFLARRDTVLSPLLDVVQRGQRAGEIVPDVPPPWVLATVASLMVNAVRAVAGGTVEPQPAVDLVCRSLFDGLAADGRRTS